METKIIKVNPKELKLLELNARFMKANEFKKLVSNVKRDGCLTQLPFCVYDKEYVPISTIIGRSDIKAKDARIVNKAIDDMIAKSIIKKTEKERGLAILAESYLGKKG